MGTIYKRGDTYWIQFYQHGVAYRESSKSKEPKDAEDLLKLRESEILIEGMPGSKFERTRLEDLAKDHIADLESNGRASLQQRLKITKRRERPMV